VSSLEIITTTGQDALAELERLRAKAKTTGAYPILFGEAEEFERIEECMEDDFDAAQILKASESIVLPDWFQTRAESEPELYQTDEGDWPDECEGEIGIITHLDIASLKPHKEVVIGLLKIPSAWEAFAKVNWGGWNDCPFPQEHCAVHRYWASKYGAEVVSITSDIVQCAVASPPTEREAALQLAQEQYIYCYDIVEQGTQTIAALAAGLVNSKHWYFWWD
jgi:Domain of unknown function (DUF4253)